MSRRLTVLALVGVLVPAMSSCGPLAGAPNLTPTPLPTAERPLLRKQARDLKAAITKTTHVFPPGQVKRRVLLDDRESECYFHDPDDPVLPPTTRNWEYAIRVDFTDRDHDDAHEHAFEAALREDGWKIRSGFGQLVAVKKGMYLEIGTTRSTYGPLVVRGYSRCVRAGGQIMSPEPPMTVAPRTSASPKT